jgi:hypothetical protein
MARDVAALLPEKIAASAAVPRLLAPAKYPPGAEFDARRTSALQRIR